MPSIRIAARRMVWVLGGAMSIVIPTALHAQDIPPGCQDVCAASCVKPWSIQDRWDDFSVNWGPWTGNGIWDGESFTDLNANGLHDSGEPFVDGSNLNGSGASGPNNGQYDAEFYDPFLTGYVAWKDLGLQLTLKANTGGSPQPNQYYAVDLPGDLGGNDYRWYIANCNSSLIAPGDLLRNEAGGMIGPIAQGTKDLINKDPGAYWDDGCQCVRSAYENSPRTLILPLADPRIALAAGTQFILVAKLAGFFLEATKSNGDMTGRLVIVAAPGGTICAEAGGFLHDCPVDAKATTWGHLKATYR